MISSGDLISSVDLISQNDHKGLAAESLRWAYSGAGRSFWRS